MYYGNRKLTAARQHIKQQLDALGWHHRECRYPVDGKIDLHAHIRSPHVGDLFFWHENCLKRFNTGEAYWRTESTAHQLAHLAWRCNDKNPRNLNPLDTNEAFAIASQMLVDGIDFEYEDPDAKGRNKTRRDTVRLIDWETPENNTFEYLERWRGAMNDRFGWDFVLCINATPVAAIVLEPDEDATPCQTALDLAQYQLDHDYQFPVYCHALVVGNGKQLRYGDPLQQLDQYRTITSLDEVLRPTEFLKKRILNFEI